MKTSTQKKLARTLAAIIVTAYASVALAVDPPVCSSPGNPPGCKPAKPVDDGTRGTK